jgi:dienelactone hydrolase
MDLTNVLYPLSPKDRSFIRSGDSIQKRRPVVIITGSWRTVKEQMATTYAHRLADHGYTAFIFDFADESHPATYESAI